MAWNLGKLRYHRLIGIEFSDKVKPPVAGFLMPNGDFGVTRSYGDSILARCNFLVEDFSAFTQHFWEHPAFNECEITSSSFERGVFIRIVIHDSHLASLFKLTYFGECLYEH